MAAFERHHSDSILNHSLTIYGRLTKPGEKAITVVNTEWNMKKPLLTFSNLHAAKDLVSPLGYLLCFYTI